MGRQASDAADATHALMPAARAGLILVLTAACAAAVSPATSQAPGRKEAQALALDAATLARITAVDPVHAETMGRQPTTLEVQPLPFYKRFRLLTADVELPHKPLRFRYADDGTQAVYLSGAPEEVYKVNHAEGLALTADQVVPYVRFFLSVAGGPGRQLVERPSDVDWLPASENDPPLKAKRAAASGKIGPLQASPHGDGFRVTGTAVQGDPYFTHADLVRLQLKVSPDGRVTVDTPTVLEPALPVAASF
jgi:hypothetical protein